MENICKRKSVKNERTLKRGVKSAQPRLCVLLTSWNISLLRASTLRAAHLLEYLTSCVPRLCVLLTSLESLASCVPRLCVLQSSRGRRLFWRQRTHVLFDWPAIAQHMRTHVRFNTSCGLSLFAYLDFLRAADGRVLGACSALGIRRRRGERLRCGRLGPSSAT